MISSRTKRWSAGFIFIGIIIGIILTTNLNWTPKGFASRVVALDEPSQNKPSQEVLRLQDTGKAFTAVSREILPTVVSISTSRIVKRSQQEDDFWSPFFKDFFGREFQQPETQRLQGLGSGVIVSKDGYILTNNHVIENADDIKVNLYDNRNFEAKLVGTDPLTEVAVIKIQGENLPVARLGNSDELEVGEWVLAVGNPLQLNSTVTAGIVSAIGRSIGIIQDSEPTEGGSYAIENFIQTDAAINPGNSGGALVNLKAEVIGINTAIATSTRYYMGYGFAVPINLAKKIMNDLIGKGYVTRAYIGIGMRPVDENVAERFGLDRPRGVRIDQVIKDSPAEKAGLKPLDIILKLDGKETNKSNEIQNAVALKNPGDEVVLTIFRDGKERDVRVKLGQRDTGKETVQEAGDDEMPELGISVIDLDNSVRSELRLGRDDQGVVVSVVTPYSNAADAGIQRGDLITRIEDTQVKSVSDYRKVLRSRPKGKVAIFNIKRENTELYAFVKIPQGK